MSFKRLIQLRKVNKQICTDPVTLAIKRCEDLLKDLQTIRKLSDLQSQRGNEKGASHPINLQNLCRFRIARNRNEPTTNARQSMEHIKAVEDKYEGNHTTPNHNNLPSSYQRSHNQIYDSRDQSKYVI